jgi:hypothetical protein
MAEIEHEAATKGSRGELEALLLPSWPLTVSAGVTLRAAQHKQFKVS